MPEICPECGESAVYYTSDKKRKLCIKCKHEEAVDEKSEGLLKKRIDEIPEVSMIEGGYEITAAVKQILDEFFQEFPTLSGWNDPAIAYQAFYAEVQAWKKKWGGNAKK